jgi:hypothetical protein
VPRPGAPGSPMRDQELLAWATELVTVLKPAPTS